MTLTFEFDLESIMTNRHAKDDGSMLI